MFNVDVTKDTSIEKYSDILKSKETKHIIIFLINDEKMIEMYEESIKVLNELIIVIGPNDHHISMYCGKLGIEDYVPIHEFKAENLKNVILSKKNTLLNKNKYGNKIIAIGGIAGGIGSTTIAMNMSDLISQNLPDKNLLYIAIYSIYLYISILAKPDTLIPSIFKLYTFTSDGETVKSSFPFFSLYILDTLYSISS